MSRRISLRLRVTLLFTLMGVLLSISFATAVNYIAEQYEHVMVEEVLASQAEDFSVRYRLHPDAALPGTERFKGYLRRADGSGYVPDRLKSLPAGINEPEFTEDDGVHVGVFDVEAGRLYLSINLGGVEQIEAFLHGVFLIIILVGALVSALLGWLLSGTFVKPVRELAMAVDELPSEPRITHLSRELADDELGQLGQAIDAYQRRLVEAEQAEQAFLADASHELRTPIAVVQGAAELLQEDAADVPAMQPRLQRLQRGVTELADLLDALLRLARHRVAEPAEVMLHQWLGTLVEALPCARDGQLAIRIAGQDAQRCLPLHDAELLLRGLLRRLLPPNAAGVLELRTTAHSIELDYQQSVLAQSASQPTSRPQLVAAPSDRRVVSALMERLATRLQWRIDERASERGLLRIELP